jgi:N-acetylmuramoyl-L-alanine amidase
MRGPVLLTVVVASFSALRVISALAEEAACANSTGMAPITAASQPLAKREPSDVPRVELAARLAATGATATDVFKRMREGAARELAGRPDGVGDVNADALRNADDAIARQIRIDQGVLPPPSFTALAKLPGRPQIEGLDIIYLNPLGDPARANAWQNIIVHQTEGPPGSARREATDQFAHPTKRGVTLWVETDGTVYWAVAENVIPTHGEGGDRNDNKYIDNAKTYHAVVKTNSIGVEFIGNFPDVAKPVTAAQKQAWLLLAPFLQERYGIAPDHIYAHNWIDFKDQRYCEGCELAALVRTLGYCPSKAP